MKSLKELVDIINTPQKKVEKMNFKKKQEYYNAKTKVHRVFHDSSRKGTYVNYEKFYEKVTGEKYGNKR